MPYEKIGKNEPVCIADEVPFDIPESWEWVRFKNLVNYSMGKTPPRKEAVYWDDSDIPWVSISDMISDGIVKETKEKVNIYAAESVFKGKLSKAGTLLMSFKLTVGKVSILGIDAFHNEAIISIYPYVDTDKIETNYLFATLPLLSQSGDTKSAIKGSTLNSDSLDALLIPLPPLQEQKRIVKKLNELTPAVQQYSAKYSHLEKLNTVFPDQIKKSILQEAVQGKLVPQDPNDEPASVLLERIRAEKEQLIKAGKIKRDKHESVIFRRDNSYYEKVDGIERCIDDEIPFEIPASWAWTRLFSLCSNITDGEHKTPRRTAEYVGYYLLSARNIRDGHLSLEDVDYVDGKEYSLISKRCNPKRNNILISCSGSIGRVCLVPDDGNYVMVRSAAVAVPILVHSKYLMYALQSEIVQKQIKSKIKQAVQANLFQGEIRNLIIPVPPFDEQQRIVRKLDYLLIKTKL